MHQFLQLHPRSEPMHTAHQTTSLHWLLQHTASPAPCKQQRISDTAMLHPINTLPQTTPPQPVHDSCLRLTGVMHTAGPPMHTSAAQHNACTHQLQHIPALLVSAQQQHPPPSQESTQQVSWLEVTNNNSAVQAYAPLHLICPSVSSQPQVNWGKRAVGKPLPCHCVLLLV